MELYVICFKNLKVGAFTQPQFIDIEPEKAAEQLERSLILNIDDASKIAPYNDLDMYQIGLFNDKTGVFIQKEPVLLLSCREVIQSHIKVAPVPEVKEEKVNENA